MLIDSSLKVSGRKEAENRTSVKITYYTYHFLKRKKLRIKAQLLHL